MVKFDYFGMLEELSSRVCDAVRLSAEKSAAKQELCAIRMECDKKICELEDALFSDFIPPLERDNIAAYAHCLSRVIDKAIDYHTELSSMRRFCPSGIKNDEAAVCVELSEKLAKSTALLRNLKSPDKIPDLVDFRETLRKGRKAHGDMIAKLNAGSLPKSCAQMAIISSRLRFELSRCFDELVEIMLGNI